jgi:hypothetical protein
MVGCVVIPIVYAKIYASLSSEEYVDHKILPHQPDQFWSIIAHQVMIDQVVIDQEILHVLPRFHHWQFSQSFNSYFQPVHTNLGKVHVGVPHHHPQPQPEGTV